MPTSATRQPGLNKKFQNLYDILALTALSNIFGFEGKHAISYAYAHPLCRLLVGSRLLGSIQSWVGSGSDH